MCIQGRPIQKTFCNGIYGEAQPEGGIFFRLQVYEREWIFLVYERVGKCVISVCKKAQKC